MRDILKSEAILKRDAALSSGTCVTLILQVLDWPLSQKVASICTVRPQSVYFALYRLAVACTGRNRYNEHAVITITAAIYCVVD